MFKLRFSTAGESHGKSLIGIIEGIPANLEISPDYINKELRRRQVGYGRGERMKIEHDQIEIISGVRWGKTTGSPVALSIKNSDWENWQKGMSILKEDSGSIQKVTRPRPGHADLPGIIKYNQDDIRNVLERSSARETAMRVAIGSLARRFLEEFSIQISGFVISIGNVSMEVNTSKLNGEELRALCIKSEDSDVRCPDEKIARLMKEAIDRAKNGGYSLGGTFLICAIGLPVGLGSYIQWDKRLDARLAHAFMGIQAIKGIEIGGGFEITRSPGSEVMDEIFSSTDPSQPSFFRKTNYAGGIEGGITNGMPVIVKAAMKPIPTQKRPLSSVDIESDKPVEAAYERSDICAVPAASVVAEAMMAIAIADAFLEKFAGDSIEETRGNFKNYLNIVKG